jgi:tetraacyldisaccharide 4'-kinase
MDQRAFKDIMSGRRGGPGAACLRGAALALSKPYALIMRLRRWGYRRGVLASHSAPVPVISVGNVTAGGTGKTPMVAWIVHRLMDAGRTPAIVMRGYRAARAEPGAQPRSDEAELLAALTGAAVIVEPDRLAGARKAASQGADVVVLDDAFQHRRLRRDLDIVLIDAAEPLGLGHCLPRGLLREPPTALADADVIVITHADEVSPARLGEIHNMLACFCRPAVIIAEASHRPMCVIDEDGTSHAPGLLAGKKLAAFCGLGAPEHFFDSLKALGADLVACTALDDHAPYSEARLAELAAHAGQAGQAGAEAMITTQKDHVRLAHIPAPAGPAIWQLAIEMDVGAGKGELVARIVGSALAR